MHARLLSSRDTFIAAYNRHWRWRLTALMKLMRALKFDELSKSPWTMITGLYAKHTHNTHTASRGNTNTTLIITTTHTPNDDVKHNKSERQLERCRYLTHNRSVLSLVYSRLCCFRLVRHNNRRHIRLSWYARRVFMIPRIIDIDINQLKPASNVSYVTFFFSFNAGSSQKFNIKTWQVFINIKRVPEIISGLRWEISYIRNINVAFNTFRVWDISHLQQGRNIKFLYSSIGLITICNSSNAVHHFTKQITKQKA